MQSWGKKVLSKARTGGGGGRICATVVNRLKINLTSDQLYRIVSGEAKLHKATNKSMTSENTPPG